MRTFRTKESESKYQKYIENGGLLNGCALCRANSIKEFDHWRIIANDFPYDEIAETHDMVVLKRHASDTEINEEERLELDILKDSYIKEHYKYILEPTKGGKTIPGHLHLHLLVGHSKFEK